MGLLWAIVTHIYTHSHPLRGLTRANASYKETGWHSHLWPWNRFLFVCLFKMRLTGLDRVGNLNLDALRFHLTNPIQVSKRLLNICMPRMGLKSQARQRWITLAVQLACAIKVANIFCTIFKSVSPLSYKFFFNLHFAEEEMAIQKKVN